MKVLSAEKFKPSEGGPSFSFRHRLFRMLWSFIWFLLASWTPPPFFAWRRLILVLFGAKLSKKARVYSSAKIWYPPNLFMGDYSTIGPSVNCYNMAKITIMDRALVSQGAFLCAGTHDISSRDFQLVVRPIVLEEYAWIAADAFVGPGVVVGREAVIGARAVLFKDAVMSGVYVGNPAQLIKQRNILE